MSPNVYPSARKRPQRDSVNSTPLIITSQPGFTDDSSVRQLIGLSSEAKPVAIRITNDERRLAPRLFLQPMNKGHVPGFIFGEESFHIGDRHKSRKQLLLFSKASNEHWLMHKSK